MTNRRHFGSVRKLPSRRFQASYWHEGARHKAPDTFAAKADAPAYLATVETDVRRSAWIDPQAGSVTLRKLAAEWLEANPRKRASSRARDESILDSGILPILGNRKIVSVTRHDVQALVDDWATRLAPSTVARQYAVLRAMFTYAEDTARLARNPCRRIRLPAARLVERPVLSANELKNLAEALGPGQAPFMWIGAVLGLRWAEAAGLTVGRLDMLGGKLTVDRQLARSGALEAPKSEGCPHLRLPEVACRRAGSPPRSTWADGDRWRRVRIRLA